MTEGDLLAGLCAYLLLLAGSDRADWPDRGRAALDVVLSLVADPALSGVETLDSVPRALRPVLERLGLLWAADPMPRFAVSALAAAGAVSPGYLHRLFRDCFSLSVTQAVESLRTARAETLLTRTDLTAQEVAARCGYADLSHFSHRFRASHGVPPSAYRRGGHDLPSVLDQHGVRRLIALLPDGTG